MPGEFLQIDWGEMRDMPFSKEGMGGQTRYFFAARLKYSRYMFVSFQSDMREETRLGCLIACFQTIRGVPWAVVTDNMKTAVLGRDEGRQQIWNPAYQQLAVEFKFHPDVCAPTSGNQKGSVENLVLCRHFRTNFFDNVLEYVAMPKPLPAARCHPRPEARSEAVGSLAHRWQLKQILPLARL